MGNVIVIIAVLVVGIAFVIGSILYRNNTWPFSATGGTSASTTLSSGAKSAGKALSSMKGCLPGILLILFFLWVIGGGPGGCVDANFGDPGPRVSQPQPASAVGPVPPADRAQVEATTFRVRDVPVDTTEMIRSPRFKIPEEYEAIPLDYSLVDGTVLRMYCYETETSPGERQWSPGDRCIGGWGSFALVPAPTRKPFTVAWQPRWRGPRH